jgi:Zn-dependent protease
VTPTCAGCGAELAASLLACPSCGALVHAETLKRLAAEATRAEAAGDAPAALAAWRQVLQHLPTGTVQHQRVLATIQALSAQTSTWAFGAAPGPPANVVASADAAPPDAAAAPRTGWRKWAAGLGSVGVLLAKLKWVILFVLAKGKVLLVGLTQAKTFLSMAIAVGVYATIYGWWFALGLVLSIYVHEMGHVVALRRYGIAATAPMFIPGFGAYVRLKQYPATPGEDARVGLAGPVWGAAAAVAALVLGTALHRPTLIAIAHVGAWINLFNLLPVWQLDGGRGFAALSRQQRGLVAGCLWLLALLGADGVLWLLAIAASFRAASKGTAPEQGDRVVLATYLLLTVGLVLLMAAAKL